MTETEKKLLQAQHRSEEAQARNRVKKRKARTRRLIQEGAIWKRCCRRFRLLSCLRWRDIFHEGWENKSKFQIGGLREAGGLLLFSPVRAHLLTTCKTGGGMPAASCALRGGFRFLRKATDNATAFADAAVIVCAIGQIPSLQPTLFSNRLRKPATGSFAAEMDRRSARPFSLLQKRNRKKKTR